MRSSFISRPFVCVGLGVLRRWSGASSGDGGSQHRVEKETRDPCVLRRLVYSRSGAVEPPVGTLLVNIQR